jgi:hypothetical protein
MESFNYFNYFTEIEEYFWRKRGAHLLVSPLDWAIVETWQKAGIPLSAVLKGIDRAFESWERARPAAEPFSRDELRKYLERCGARLREAAEKQRTRHAALASRLEDAASRLVELLPLTDAPGALDLEDLERRLTVLEEKLTAALSADADEEILLAIRREMDRSLAPYRRKMSAEQLAQLERQYTQKRLFEQFDVPRLSLFYLT